MKAIIKACKDYYNELPSHLLQNAGKNFGVNSSLLAVIVLVSGRSLKVEARLIGQKSALLTAGFILEELLAPLFKRYVSNEGIRDLANRSLVELIIGTIDVKYLKAKVTSNYMVFRVFNCVLPT